MNTELTKRERAVIGFKASGMTDDQIGQYLEISHKTVAAHSANARAKLCARNTTNAVAIAIRRGIIGSLAVILSICGLAATQSARPVGRGNARIARTRRNDDSGSDYMGRKNPNYKDERKLV